MGVPQTSRAICCSLRSTGHHQLGEFDFDPRKLLRRRSSLVVADLPTRELISNALASSGTVPEENGSEEESDGPSRREAKEEKKKPPPTQFQEPDANSLLDSFGF